MAKIKDLYKKILGLPLILKIKEKFTTYTSKWSVFSYREKTLVVSCITVLVLMGLYFVFDKISTAFSDQQIRLEAAETELKTLPPILINYSRLKNRKDSIEAKYKEVEIQEGALSLLENLVKEKTESAPGTFTITEKSSPFGSSYNQRTFTVKFKTAKVESLVAFLNEVVKGSRPLLLTRVDVVKSYSGDKLEVEVDISSIEKKNGKDDNSITKKS